MPAGGARHRRGNVLTMPRPAARSWSWSYSRCRCWCRSRCGGGVPVPFVRDAGGAVAPSLPIKLVFLSPPALPAPLTGGAAAAAARTMGPRVPAPGTGRRHRRTGPCRRHSFLPRPLEYSGTRAGREVLPRHRLQRTLPEEPPVPMEPGEGMSPGRAGSAAGSASPSPAHPSPVRAPSASCLLYGLTAAGRERRGTVPPGVRRAGRGRGWWWVRI